MDAAHRENVVRPPNYTPLATVDIAGGLIVRASVLDVVNEDAQLVPNVEGSMPLASRCVQGKASSRQVNHEQYEAHRQRHAAKMAMQEAQDEWRWAATAFNLHRLMSLLQCRAGPSAELIASPS